VSDISEIIAAPRARQRAWAGLSVLPPIGSNDRGNGGDGGDGAGGVGSSGVGGFCCQETSKGSTAFEDVEGSERSDILDVAKVVVKVVVKVV
jgi:hypothetical protein